MKKITFDYMNEWYDFKDQEQFSCHHWNWFSKGDTVWTGSKMVGFYIGQTTDKIRVSLTDPWNTEITIFNYIASQKD